jgi:hypothetical protein
VRVAFVLLLVFAAVVAPACGESRPAEFWTVKQAESIKSIRGTTLETTTCTGIGASRASGYRRFSCTGKTTPRSLPDLPVRVRYVLDPRGEYRANRSAYLATNVRFDSFGVP